MKKSEIIDKLRDDDHYYGDFGKQYLSNSNIKTLLGEKKDVIYVKGSGKDMSNIEEDGFPALEMDNLLQLKKLKKLDDFDMVNHIKEMILNYF